MSDIKLSLTFYFCLNLLLNTQCYGQESRSEVGMDRLAVQIQQELAGVEGNDIGLQIGVLWKHYDALSQSHTIDKVEQVFLHLSEEVEMEKIRSIVYLILASNQIENSKQIDYIKVEKYLKMTIVVRSGLTDCERLELMLEAPLVYLKGATPNYEAARILLMQIIEESGLKNCHMVFFRARNYLATRIYEGNGQMIKSLELKRASIEIADSLDVLPEVKSFVNSKVGNLYFYMENFEAALLYYLEAHHHFEASDLRNYLAVSNLNNVAMCYGKLNEFDNALAYFKKALEINNSEDYDLEPWRRTAWVGILNGNIGDMYFEGGMYEKAIPFLRKDVELSGKNYSAISHLISLNRLAIALFKTGEVAEGKLLLDGAKAEYRQISNSFNRHGNYRSHLKVRKEQMEASIAYYKAIENYNSAFFLAERYSQMQDSISKLKRKQNLSWIDMQLQLDSERKENTKLLSSLRSSNQMVVFSAVFIIIVAFSLFITWKYYRSKAKTRELANARLIAEISEQKERELRKQVEEKARAEKQELENDRLEEELAVKQRELAMYTQRLVEKNQKLQELLSLVQEQKPINRQLEGLIKQELTQDEEWDSYQQVFEQVHPGFFNRLSQHYPQLTQNDLRYAAYVKMGLSSKEIASVLNINAESLKKTRYRIRQKINLDSSQKINDFIMSF